MRGRENNRGGFRRTPGGRREASPEKLPSIEQMFDTGEMRAGALEHDAEEIRDNKETSETSGRLALVQASLTTAATLARERTLPIAEGMAGLVPTDRLQRGSNVAVHGVGATSFALALVGEAVRSGSFLAIVASPSFGLGACIDFDIPLRRVVQFTVDEPPVWGQVVAAIIEGFDIVLLAEVPRIGAGHARKLAARNRERGSVLVRVGGPAWPDAADLRFDVGESVWSGLGQGHGHLQARRVAVQVTGRRHHGASQSHQILLPAPQGGVALGQPEPVAERFAGSDIDAMIDATHGAQLAEDPDLSGRDGDAVGAHLGATA